MAVQVEMPRPQPLAPPARVFARDGGEISTVSIGADGTDFLRDLADAAGGRFVRDQGGSLTANVLLSLM